MNRGKQMKIDGHIHITPPDIIKYADKIGDRESYFKWLSTSPQNKFATGDEVAKELSQAGFEKGVVFGFAFQDPSLCRYVNDYVIEEMKKYPEAFIGFMVVSPQDKQMVYEIERCYNAGLKGIGELFPEGQKWHLPTVHETTDLRACCEKYQLPVLMHTNETVGHVYTGKTKVSLNEVESFIKNHSKTPIILAHLGGGLMFYEAMKELKESFQHVYYDTAAALFLYDPSIYRMARELGILHKIIFGSDYPLVSPTRYEKSLEASGLKKEEIAQIMGDNLEKILLY